MWERTDKSENDGLNECNMIRAFSRERCLPEKVAVSKKIRRMEKGHISNILYSETKMGDVDSVSRAEPRW